MQTVLQTAHQLLPEKPDLPAEIARQLRVDFERFARSGIPVRVEHYLAAIYGLDVATHYAGLPIKNPWGKASGQLSMTEQQVAEDAEAGLGFCVLKTVIAQDAAGGQSMRAWAIPESRMVLERIRGANGREGWTVSWKGRGWYRTFGEYLSFVQAARQIGDAAGMLVVPSCKYHLPAPDDPTWRTAEYEYTTQRLLETYEAEPVENPKSKNENRAPMPIEKDFSPTLAGSELATQESQILEWLHTVPGLIRGAQRRNRLRVGLKLFNALFDDQFQLEMLRTVAAAGPARPDFVIYANRLFDPTREFDGHRGIAVGGPDLSDRNLRVLDEFQRHAAPDISQSVPLELCATGDICSGKIAVEYLLRGASSFQLHTFFQLPAGEYRMRRGSKIAKALHLLYFHPDDGLVAWLLHVAYKIGLRQTSATIRLCDLVGVGLRLEEAVRQ